MAKSLACSEINDQHARDPSGRIGAIWRGVTRLRLIVGHQVSFSQDASHVQLIQPDSHSGLSTLSATLQASARRPFGHVSGVGSWLSLAGQGSFLQYKASIPLSIIAWP